MADEIISINPKNNRSRPLFFCFFSAALLFLSFPKFDLWFLAWVGLLPLFFAINGKRPLICFLLSYFTGFLFFLGTIYWLIHVTLLGYLLLVFYLAIYFGMLGFCVSLFSKKSFILKLLILPSIWVVLEFLRGHLLTGFGWAFLGYSQYQILPVIQIADIAGVYGVSFLIVMVNIAIFEILQNKNSREKYSAFKLVIFVLVACLGYGFFRLIPQSNAKKIKVSVIQGNIPEDIKWEKDIWQEILDKHIDLSKIASQDKPDIIIWPETAYPGYFRDPPILFEKLIESVKELKTNLLFGAITPENLSIYNSAVLISPEGEIVKTYQKLHLVPFGEYVPFYNIFSFLPQLAVLGDFTSGKEFTVFSLNENPAKKLSVLICFEDTIPELSRQFVKRGANLLVNITDDSWFKDTVAPYQHLQASVFRAIENRAPLVRAANTGVSVFIDSRGKILDRVYGAKNKQTFISGYKTSEMDLRNSFSFYSRFGDVFVLLCLIVFILATLFVKKKNV